MPWSVLQWWSSRIAESTAKITVESKDEKLMLECTSVLVCVATGEFEDGLRSTANIMLESEDKKLMRECTRVSPKIVSCVVTHCDRLIYYEAL